MTSTERLRALLDERGVEWTNPNSCLRDEMTSWVANGFDYDAFEVPDGTLLLTAAHQDDLTPEQAITATLGVGTCHMEVRDNLAETDGMGDVWIECDECNWQMPLEPTTPRFKHCPNCGREVSE